MSENNSGSFYSVHYFLDAHGDTGKRLINFIAFSRIDRRMKLPSHFVRKWANYTVGLKIATKRANQFTNLQKNSAILQICKLIVWNECMVTHKRSLALDKTLTI